MRSTLQKPSKKTTRDEAKVRLRQVAIESAKQDEGQIITWLDLAKKVFDKDRELSRSAA
jgi:hypothetical protein